MINDKVLNKLVKISYSNLELPDSEKLHFSYLFHKRKLISVGWNDGWSTHSLAKKFGHRYSAIHSELGAIKSCQHELKSLKKCTMVNIRIGKNGQVAMSKPCEYCRNMLEYFGIKNILYSDKNGNFLELKL